MKIQTNVKISIIALFTLFISETVAQEYSAGVNTEDPNPYAVLHLVAPNGDQGLLIPQLTTQQRNTLGTELQDTENGLMVFDSDLKKFFYWDAASSWIPFIQNLNFTGTTLNILNGNGVDLSSLVDDADADPANEIQTLTKTGNTITLSNSGGTFNLGEGTPTVGQTLEWDGSNWIPVTPPGAQTLSFSGATLDILNGNNVDLSTLIDDADPDPSNEIQVLTKAGNTVSLSNGGGSFTDEVDDADNVIGNENQTVSAGTGISVNQAGQDFAVTNTLPDQVVGLTDGGSGNVVIGGSYPNLTVDVPNLDDLDADPSNENQTVSAGTGISVNQVGQDFVVTNTLPDQVVKLTDGGSGNVVISGTYPNLTVDVPNLDDADASPTNEIQTITSGTGITVTPTGNDYQITNAAPDVPVNLSAASLNVSISGGYPNYILDVPSLDDADASVTNEIQDLDYTGNILSLGGDPTPTTVDFSNWDMDVTDDFTTADETDPTVPANIKDGIDWTEVSGKPAGFADDIDDVDDADNVIGNEVQDLSLSAAHSLSLSLSAATADLSPYMQTLSFTSPNLTVSGTDGNTVDLSVLNTDNQDLSLTGNTLSITNDGTTVDLSGYLDNTDNQTVDQFDLTGSTLNLSLLNDGTIPYTVDLSSFSIASVAGAAGNYLTNDGTVTSWDPLGTLAQLNTITSTEITDGSVSEADLANSIAGNGIAGGAGTPLSVNLSGTSGLQITTDQLEMPNVISAQTYTIVLSGTITVDSKGRVTNFGASDERLKKDISRIDGVLDKILKVNGYTYHYKDQQDSILQHGVIAQELKQIFPDLVITNDKGFLSVNYAGLLPILLEALKEQQAIIENLQMENSQQKQINEDQGSRITAMEGKLDQLLQLISP